MAVQRPTQNRISQGVHGNYNAVDYAADSDWAVYAPEDGTIQSYAWNGNCGNNLKIASPGGVHGMCHIEQIYVKVGDTVKRGQLIAQMGWNGYVIPAGPGGRHLHHVYNTKDAGYVYPLDRTDSDFIIYDPSSGMPPVNSQIRLKPKDVRSTWVSGTQTKAGSINVTDDTFIYTVRGYDPKYPGRIIINSASAGGNGVALALYYTDGSRIEGWETY